MWQTREHCPQGSIGTCSFLAALLYQWGLHALQQARRTSPVEDPIYSPHMLDSSPRMPVINQMSGLQLRSPGQVPMAGVPQQPQHTQHSAGGGPTYSQSSHQVQASSQPQQSVQQRPSGEGGAPMVDEQAAA